MAQCHQILSRNGYNNHNEKKAVISSYSRGCCQNAEISIVINKRLSFKGLARVPKRQLFGIADLKQREWYKHIFSVMVQTVQYKVYVLLKLHVSYTQRTSKGCAAYDMQYIIRYALPAQLACSVAQKRAINLVLLCDFFAALLVVAEIHLPSQGSRQNIRLRRHGIRLSSQYLHLADTIICHSDI